MIITASYIVRDKKIVCDLKADTQKGTWAGVTGVLTVSS